MRNLLMSTAMVLAAGIAAAEDVALVLGTERYSNFDRLNRGDEPAEVASYLGEAGFQVLSLTDPNSAQVTRALDGFVNRVPQAERVVVALSGRFINDGDRVWYLTADAPVPSYLTLDQTAVSVDSIMQVMARQPGSAILLLGYDDDELDVHDAWISEGLGDLDIPQGVTVLYGGPREIARFMANELVEPEGDLARLVAANRNIRADGFLPREMIFIGPETRPSGVQQQDLSSAAERALWSGAVAIDTLEAYQNYQERYPRGEFFSEAQSRIDAIRAEPFRDARLTEEALRIPRAERQQIQRHLNLLNFDTRGVDGIFGPGTRSAVRNWQQQNGYQQSGFLNAEQISRLAGQANRRQAEIEEEQAQRDLEARRAENAYWEETGASGNVSGLRAYLQRYPEGRYAAIARERLETADQASREELRIEEEALWSNTRSIGNIAAFETYLQQYPNGQYVEQARSRLAELRAAAERDSGGGNTDRFAQAERDLGLNNLTRRLVETHLQALGMNPGSADGEFDQQARQAIRRYQNERGLQVTGYLDARTAAMMLSEAQ